MTAEDPWFAADARAEYRACVGGAWAEDCRQIRARPPEEWSAEDRARVYADPYADDPLCW